MVLETKSRRDTLWERYLELDKQWKETQDTALQPEMLSIWDELNAEVPKTPLKVRTPTIPLLGETIPKVKPLPEVTKEEPVTGLFRRVYPSYGMSEPDFLNEINKRATENPDTFLEDLRIRGRSDDTIQVLQMFSAEPLTEDVVNNFFQGMPEISPEQNLMIKALPLLVNPRTIDWATKYFSSPDKLRREIITVGRNADTEALVKSQFPNISEQGLRDYFSSDFRPVAPMITTLLGRKVAYPMTDKEWASMSQREQTFYREHPQEWLADRDNWAKLRVIDDRIRIVAETLGIDIDADTPTEQVLNFVNMALWVVPIPLAKVLQPVYQAGKKLLPTSAKAVVEAVEQFLTKARYIKKGEVKVAPEVIEKIQAIAKETPLPEVTPAKPVTPAPTPTKGAVRAVPEKVTPIPEVKIPEVGKIIPEKGIPTEGKAANIRLEKFNEDIRPTIKEWADTHPAEVQEARRGVISDAQVRIKAEQLTSEVGGDLDKLRAEWKPGVAWNAEELTAMRGALADKTKLVLDTQKLVKASPSTENLLKLEMAIREQAAVQETVHGLTAEAGRALRSFRQSFNDAGTDAQKMESLLKKLGKENLEKISKLLGQLDITDPIAVNKFIQSLSKPRIGDYLTEIFYNSILSGPKTHIVNSLSNTFNAIFSPIERTASALIDLPLSAIQGRARQRFFNEVPADVFGAIKGIPEGFRQFAYVIKNGISLDEITKWEQRTPAFKGKLGAVVTFPSRMLQGADALMKSVNMRAAINAEAHRIASISKLTGKAFDDRVAELLSNPTPEMLAEATKVAEYRLFRAPLGKTGQALMKLREFGEIGGFQPGRFLVPFIRTPMNLVKYGLERTPLGFANPKMWNNLAAKNPEAADQLARAVIGSVGLASLAWYAKEGKITGSPPRSPSERERFYREGKQPYAIRVGEFWVSYQRLEPFNQLLSQVAIIVEAINSKDKTVDQKIWDAGNTFGQNFVSQTYMRSLSDFLNILAEPERYAGNWLNRFATVMVVPMSSASRTAAQMLDDVVRDPQNVVETIQANIPDFWLLSHIGSKNVQAKITALGEDIKRKSPPWFPISVTPVEETVLSQELERLKVNIGMAGKTIKGVKLSDQEQVEYQKLVGGAIKTDLEKLMLAPDYWKADDIEKNKMIDSVLSKARDRASFKMREKMFTTGSTEERITTITTALKTADSQLGKVISATPEFSHEPPNIYDVAHELDSSYRTLLEGIPESSVKDAPPSVHSWYQKEKNLVTKNSLANKSLIQINTDPQKGDTFEDFVNQLEDKEKYPDNPLISVDRRTIELLKKYHSLSATEQKDFLDKNPELSLNPQRDWLESHPEENARLSLWGEGKLLTKEAYESYNKMVKELDLVDSVLPDVLPDKLPIFLLNTEKTFRDVTAKIETARLITDEKLRDETIDKLRQTKIGDFTYKDITRKIDALSVGTDEIPTPETTINAWVERGKKIDEFSPNSAEAKLWLIDHPDIHKWALDNELLTDDGKDWNIPALRIDANYHKEDAEYKDILVANEGSEESIATKAYLAGEGLTGEALARRIEYRKDNLRRKAYKLHNTETGEKFPTTEVESYVTYYEIPDIKESKRQERFVIENTSFAEAMYRITGKDIWLTKPEDVPNVAYDDIYDKYKDLFDERRDNSDSKSPYYIPPGPKDPITGLTPRETRDEQMFAENPAFKEAYYRRQAYGELWEDKYVENYTTYMLMSKKGYADERYLLAHQDFYYYAKDKQGWTSDDPEWDKIPSEKVEGLYNQYQDLQKRKVGQVALDQFREDNLDFDAWGVLVFGWVSIKDKKRRKGMTEREKALESIATTQSEFDKRIEELRKKMGGL